WRTLLAHRQLALELYVERVVALRRLLTQSQRLAPASPALLQSLERDQVLAPVPETLRRLYASEPYVLKLLHMEARLQASQVHLERLADFRAEGPAFEARPPAYSGAEQFHADL